MIFYTNSRYKQKSRETAVLWRSDYIFMNFWIRDTHCVKNVRVGSYSGPHFSAFELNTDLVRMRENADQNNSKWGYFLRSESVSQKERPANATLNIPCSISCHWSLSILSGFLMLQVAWQWLIEKAKIYRIYYIKWSSSQVFFCEFCEMHVRTYEHLIL